MSSLASSKQAPSPHHRLGLQIVVSRTRTLVALNAERRMDVSLSIEPVHRYAWRGGVALEIENGNDTGGP